MARLDTLVGETRTRLLLLLRERPLSIPELAERLGISANAVRTHVAGAERDGLVRHAGIQRGSVGKPARTYALTSQAEELFPKAYALVLVELVETLRQEDGDDAALARLRAAGRRLGARGRTGDGSASARVAGAAAFLESIGGSVSITEEPYGWSLGSAGCPLSAVVSRDPTVCALTEALVAEATGLPVVESCDKAGPRCAFKLIAPDPTAPGSQD